MAWRNSLYIFVKEHGHFALRGKALRRFPLNGVHHSTGKTGMPGKKGAHLSDYQLQKLLLVHLLIRDVLSVME